MSFPTAWIDRIFEKLSLRYGREFLGKWEGMPIADVKTDWCDVLAGMAGHPEAIGWALDNLPDMRAPTAQEFRAICRRAPLPDVPRLEAPRALPARIAAELAKLAPIVGADPVDQKDWARSLQARDQAGERLKPIQIRFYKEALRLA